MGWGCGVLCVPPAVVLVQSEIERRQFHPWIAGRGRSCSRSTRQSCNHGGVGASNWAWTTYVGGCRDGKLEQSPHTSAWFAREHLLSAVHAKSETKKFWPLLFFNHMLASARTTQARLSVAVLRCCRFCKGRGGHEHALCRVCYVGRRAVCAARVQLVI